MVTASISATSLTDVANAEHSTARHKREAKAVVEAANADPTTRCRRCGQLARPDDPWEGGHPRPLKAEHRSCNRSAAGLEYGWNAPPKTANTRQW